MWGGTPYDCLLNISQFQHTHYIKICAMPLMNVFLKNYINVIKVGTIFEVFRVTS